MKEYDIVVIQYLEALSEFEQLHDTTIALGRKILIAMDRTYTWEQDIASQFLKKVIGSGYTIRKILPHAKYDSYHKQDVVIWDYTSVCVLIRNLFDSYFIFFHYCVEAAETDTEKDFKILFWDYYLLNKTMKALNTLNSQNDKKKQIEIDAERLYEKIKGNIYYQSLIENIKGENSQETEKKRKNFEQKIKKCEIFQIPVNSEIARRAGINSENYSLIYNFLSMHAHCDSFSIDQIAAFRTGGTEEYRLIEGIIRSDLNIAFSLFIRDFCRVFPESSEQISEEIRGKIKSISRIIQEPITTNKT